MDVWYIAGCHFNIYPDSWSEGLRVALPKGGGDVRPITIVPIFAKIFEIVLDNRLIFINDAFRKNDMYNGGFLKGSRTQDNIFILQACIQKQLNIKKHLFVAFVDFKKAFNFVNHNILFYKLFKCGLEGRTIRILRNMYSKIRARVKVNNYLYKWIEDLCGTNQGGPISPDIFRYMLVDLKDFLASECGIVINENEILLHLLWADSSGGLQRQLDGLFKFVSAYQMIINELKTKIMIFGTDQRHFSFMFNNKTIGIVEEYKYLGCIFNSCINNRGNMFKEMITYSADKGLKASFAIIKKCSSLGYVSPKIGLHLFDACVSPIINYSADIWSCGKENDNIERVQLRFIKFLLGVKSSTCSLAVYGEVGRFPMYLYQRLKIIDYWLRLERLNNGSLLSQVYLMVKSMFNNGFKSWLDTVKYVLQEAHLGIYLDKETLEEGDEQTILCTSKSVIYDNFSKSWFSAISNFPKMRTLVKFKK